LQHALGPIGQKALNKPFLPSCIFQQIGLLQVFIHCTVCSDGDFGKYFHLPVSVNFGKWILFTGKLPVNQKNQLTPLKS
jgi:hypothetical protein